MIDDDLSLKCRLSTDNKYVWLESRGNMPKISSITKKRLKMMINFPCLAACFQ